MKPARPLRIGLTGGIGSGKSTVARHFQSLGIPVIDTDEIARELTTTHPPTLEAIAATFGRTVFTPQGTLDRAALRRLVFADREARARLEAILHPRIAAEAEKRIRSLPPSTPYLILVVPLLVERPEWRKQVDRVLVVDCPESLQIARVMARDDLACAEVQAILAAQATRSERLAAAHEVIENTGDLAHLRQCVEALDRRFRLLAEDPR
ncbi:MAG: dephospho-CoA kinase [Rhodocyclaceae bacterium]|nr:dephospho-CoA kinase [Rhodocyclaceae bacterium]